ncbi:MAG: [FeFe] hydrogenase H-cluster maturation GTPase HydF [Acidobacteria bacterium]|jgi:[FeFe] hydrogenase H-cluster maturation GTPase HydF|nr:[FeFe] hydrogenase H-cluster maturation GTPase HydF [Acidobacteriota bacterium]
MAERTMRGDRLHIAIFGRRNAGKSSLINAMTGQPVAIVSDVPGTTTDPVFKALEFQPIGPVVLIDTAGIDDRAEGLGAERVKRAAAILDKSDLALLVVDAGAVDFACEDELLEKFRSRSIPAIVVANKTDRHPGSLSAWFADKPCVRISALSGEGVDVLRRRILEIAPGQWEPPFLRDLLRPGDTVVLVVPIDTGAPKGRLIMPQVKALRDALDGGALPLSCRESELPAALESLRRKPALVVTDSQAFAQVAGEVPEDVPLTSFSILSARQKGDLPALVAGVLTVPDLRPGDRVLIAESCSHHPLQDDIGRIKLPRWLNEYVGGALRIDTVPGSAYPEDLSGYKLVVHCGACTLNRREMLRRQELPAAAGVAMTNYGVLISFLKSVFPRALRPFPELFARYEHAAWPRRQGPGVN